MRLIVSSDDSHVNSRARKLGIMVHNFIYACIISKTNSTTTLRTTLRIYYYRGTTQEQNLIDNNSNTVSSFEHNIRVGLLLSTWLHAMVNISSVYNPMECLLERELCSILPYKHRYFEKRRPKKCSTTLMTLLIKETSISLSLG